MNLVLRHAHVHTVELLRQPGFWLPSVLFPALFFVFFGITAARQAADLIPEEAGIGSEVVLTQFLLFGVLGIMFFQFGVGISEERRLPWDRTLRVLPAGGAPRFLGRVLTALLFSLLSIIPVTVIALATTTVKLQPLEWLPWLAAVFAGAIPFGLMGITLGYATTPKAALPIANIGFLLLSFLGDLFVPVEQLPSFVGDIAPYLPSYHYKDFALGVIDARRDGGGWELPALYLVGWTVAFLGAALFVYRRDQGVRYR